MPRDGNLSIDVAPKTGIGIYLYTNCATVHSSTYHNALEVPNLNGNETYFIKLVKNSPTNYTDAFDWQLQVLDTQEGDYCGLPKAVAVGENQVTKVNLQHFYYTLTLGEREKITIDEPSGEHYYKISDPCKTDFYIKSGTGKNIYTNLEAGRTYQLEFAVNKKAFNWNYTVEALEGGNICEEAVLVTAGDISIPAHTANEYWFRFVMPHDGKALIRETSGTIDFTTRKDCNSFYIISKGKGYLESVNLKGGETYYVSFQTAGKTTSWSLEFAEHSTGDLCATPLSLQEGNNNIPTGKFVRWFKYLATEEEKLTLTSSNGSQIYFYDQCENPQEFHSKSDKLEVSLMPNKNYLFRIVTYNNHIASTISVTKSAPSAGESCSLALAANLGTNTIPAHTTGFLWYKIDINEEKTIGLDFSSSNRRVELWSECNASGLVQTAASNFIHFNGLNPNQTYYLKISTNGYTFDWTLNLLNDIPLGESCETAQLITEQWLTEGSNNNTMHYWYKYVMQKDGRLFAEHRINGDRNIEAYADCEGTLIKSSNKSELTIPGLKAGDEVYIRIYNEGWFTNNILLYEMQNLIGEHCTKAQLAEEGVNTIPAHELAYYWYSYTMPADGSLLLSEPSGSRQISAMNACSEATFQVSGNGQLTLKGLKQGETVYLKLDTDQQEFDWTLEHLAPAEGEDCTLAEAVQEGTHPIDPSGKESWFSFQMPKLGKVVMNTEVGIPLTLFSSCESDALVSSQGSVFYSDLAPNEWVYVKVEQNFTAASLLIEVQDYAAGDVCSLATKAVVGTNQAPHALSWQYFVVPEQGDVEISTADGSSLKDQLSVFSSCSSLNNLHLNYYSSTGSEVRVEKLSAGDILFIHWNKQEGTADFDWEVKLRTPEAQTYYWVGNGGNWSDLTHWATTSGGSTLHQQLPAYEDTVIFDQKSLDITDQRIRLDVMTAVAVLSTQESEIAFDLSGTNDLRITKSLLLNGNGTVKVDVPVKFHNEENEEMILQQGNSTLKTVEFSGGRLNVLERASYTLFSVLKKEKPLHLSFNGYTYINEFRLENTDASDTVLINNATFNTANLNAFSTITLDASGDSGIMLGGFPGRLSGESLSFPVTVTIPGNTSLEVSGNHSFKTISLHSYNTLTLEAGSIQKVEKIEVYGNAVSNLINSSEEGVQAFFEKKEGRLNISNVTLKDNGAIGGASFYAYNSLAEGLVTGWIGFKEAQEISFDPIEGTAFSWGSLALTARSSSGLPVSFEVTEGAAHLENQVLYFDGPGSVTVRAMQAGDEVYDPAEAVEQSFCIIPDAPTITILEESSDKGEALLQSNYPEGNQWYLNGQPIEGATAETLEVKSTGSYSLQLSLNGCSSEMSEGVTVTSLRDKRDKLAIRQLKAYPNPTTGTVWVEFGSNQKAGNMKASLYTLEGQEVQSGTPESSRSGEWKVKFETSHLAGGIYYIIINDGKQLFRARIQKQ